MCTGYQRVTSLFFVCFVNKHSQRVCLWSACWTERVLKHLVFESSASEYFEPFGMTATNLQTSNTTINWCHRMALLPSCFYHLNILQAIDIVNDRLVTLHWEITALFQSSISIVSCLLLMAMLFVKLLVFHRTTEVDDWDWWSLNLNSSLSWPATCPSCSLPKNVWEQTYILGKIFIWKFDLN